MTGYFLVTTWLLSVYFLVTAWLFLPYLLVTAWLHPGYFLVTFWLLPGYFLVVCFAERRNLVFLRVCHHISAGLYRYTQCSSVRFYKLMTVSCSVNPDIYGSRKFITVYRTAHTYTKMSFGNRKWEVLSCPLVAFQWGGHFQKYFHVGSWRGVIFQIIGFGIIFTISRRSC